MREESIVNTSRSFLTYKAKRLNYRINNIGAGRRSLANFPAPARVTSSDVVDCVYENGRDTRDLEKAMGVHPSEMMDREKACIPELQIGFIKNIVHPAYKILATLFPEVEDAFRAVETNRIFWERMRDVYKRRYSNSTSSLDMFEDESLEQEVLALSCDSDE
ncbi:cGMP-dependent 3',5'-cyclic phosphodiesterase [Trichonephila inaurata madagascariensis]|uniref:cGMP-dependent 3',5'-cyclic phosphodiesterase n=1 Tax=Trichonephila inaurata madagascariensis TaxID=2747483 RepID=A0A8X7CEA4_9ARAC|nr:cGMP-dependent 3',5'-cyclic phosphodiesterase [Trichonephila inaurata madagascariensis]